MLNSPLVALISGTIGRLKTLRDGMQGSLSALRASPEQTEHIADDFLHKMVDILAYALLCREAAWELKADQNRYKLLASDYYYAATFDNHTCPVFESHPLLDHFYTAAGCGFIPLQES